MKILDSLKFLFNKTGAANWISRKREQKPNALFLRTLHPKPQKGDEHFLYADSKEMLAVKEELAERCTREFPADTRPDGFAGPTGVPTDFLSTRNMSGCGMDPLPIPISDNAAFIQSQGARDSIRPNDEPMLREVIRLFFGHAAPADLHIRKDGSTSFPFFTKDIMYKKMATLKAIHNVDDFLAALASDESSELHRALNEYHSLLLYAIHERQQPNKIVLENGQFKSKPRTAPTESEARTGAYKGETYADMTARDRNGNVVEGHFAMRRRDVFGMCGVVNYVLTAIVACFRTVYLNRFAFTFKTRDRLDKQMKAARFKYVLGSDVKTMDKMIPRWFLDFVMAELTKYLDEGVVRVMRRAYQAPYVCPPPWRDTPADYNPVFGGSPLDPSSFNQHVGLPSGIAFNPDWGKLWMTFVYVVLYRDCAMISGPTEIETLLQGKHPDHALLDMSDDAVFLTNSARAAEALKLGKSPYVGLEIESPVIYLGDVFAKSGGKIEVWPNPVTYLVNALCREDNLERVANNPNAVVQHAEGAISRMTTYAHSPIFRDLNAIYEEVMRKHTGVNPNLLNRALARNRSITEVDALVKANPGVLHYKVDPKDVSPEVLDEVVATIPARDIWPHIRHLFKVPVVNTEEFEYERAA